MNTQSLCSSSAPSVNADIQLTAVLLTPQNFDSIRETIGYLSAQTVCNQMELLVLVPQLFGLDAAQLTSSTRCADFGAVSVVNFPETWAVGAANALAVREARAPLVVFCEDHSFSEPAWARFLVESHQSPHGEKRAVVGPCVCSANDHNAMSWANFLTEYGAWTAHANSHVAAHLPGHNSCYSK